MLTRDLGVYTYGAQRLLAGELPYDGILNRAGPLAHALPAVGIAPGRLLGVDDVVAARFFFMLLAIASVVLAHVLARDLFGSRLAGLVSAATLLSFQGFITHATHGPREKTPLVLLVLAVAWAMQRRRWYAVGFLVALATLTWQPVVLPLLAGVVAMVLLDRDGGRVRPLLKVTAGELVPTLLTLLVYAVPGRLGLFVDCFLRLNLEYTRTQSPLQRLGHFRATMVYGYGWSLVGLVLGLVAMLAAGALALRRRDRSAPVAAGLAVTTLGCLAWTGYAYDSWPDAFLLLPYAALGAGAAYRFLAAAVPTRSAVAAGVAWCLLAAGLATTYSLAGRSEALLAQRASTAAVLGALPPDAVLLSVEAPQAMALSGRRNPIRQQLFGKGLTRYVREELPGGMRGLAGRVQRIRPEVIAVGATPPPRWLRPVLRDYVRVGGAPGWSWYLLRSLGPETISATRTAQKQARTEHR